ncbi:MAG TPA: hypothetical protein VF120_16305 [Ktedonobacterales bacterium]
MADGVELRRWWRLFVIEAIVVLVAVAGIVAFNPWTANHFGYALPGADGLPWRIHYGGRDYSANGYCAGADWCVGQPRTCWSQAKLMSVNIWPLYEVGQIPVLFGHPYPIMNAAIPAGLTTVLLFVPVGSCYVVYALEGGP